MIKLRPRRIVAALGLIILVISGYVGWQIYQGQQMANQYASDAQILDQGSGNDSGSANPQAQGLNRITTSGVSTSLDPSSPDPLLPGSPSNPNVLAPRSDTRYQQLMSKTYQQSLQAMQNVKSDTLALQDRKLSLSAYKANILKYQETFAAAEAFVRANPPSDETLNPPYQEFFGGISLAKQAMGFVLKGISSFSVSNFYAARDMGKIAQQQVVKGYARF